MEIVILFLIFFTSFAEDCQYTDSYHTRLLNQQHQYKNGTQCFPCLPQCKSCQSKNDYTCNSGNCEDTYYYNSIMNKCEKCLISFCSQCSPKINGQLSCTKCFDAYYLTNGLCRKCPFGGKSCSGGVILTCQDSYFYDATSYSCKKCGTNCLKCNSKNKCDVCSVGFYLTSNYQCSKCLVDFCVNCISNITCNSCSVGYQLTNNLCKKYSCTMEGCQQCSNDTFCLKCLQNYYLYNSKCFYGSSLLCNLAFGPHFDKCYSCSELGRNISNAPTYCIPKMPSSQSQSISYIVDYNFTLCSNPSYFISNFSSNLTYSLKIPASYRMKIKGIFIINKNYNQTLDVTIKPTFNQSVIQIQPQIYMDYKPLKNIYCNGIPMENFSYYSLNKFYQIQTTDNYISMNFQVASPLPKNSLQVSLKQIFIQFSKCLEPNCQSCLSATLCKNCIDPYFIQQYKCVSNCSEGFLANKDYKICAIQCQFGYYEDFTSSSCVKCPLQCSSCQDQTRCLSCNAGYFYNQYTNKCIINCQISLKGFYSQITLNKCQSCTNPCLTCSKNTLNCTSCKTGYLLVHQNRTWQCVLNCPVGMYQTLNNSKGSQNYLLDAYYGVCSKCASSCYDCYIQSALCISCFPGKYLHQGKCLSSCPMGYFIYNQTFCKICKSPCAQCNKTQFNCTLCQIGYLFLNQTSKNNHCLLQCPAGYFVGSNQSLSKCQKCQLSCKQCVSLDICLKCNPGFYFRKLDNQCVASCIQNITFMNNSTNICQPCVSPCKTCQLDYIGTACLTCEKDYYLIPDSYPLIETVDNKCVLICPVGYFMQQTNNTCSSCPNECIDCESKLKCIECKINFQLNNGVCATSCNEGQFYNTQNMVCQKCDSSCLSCSQYSTKCMSCSPEVYYNALNFECLSKCYPGYFATNSMQCQVCQSPCLTCDTKKDICTGCRSGFLYSANSSCLQNCPDSYFADFSNSKCQNCSSQCLKCSSKSICSSCAAGYYFYLQTCIKICPIGYYANLTTYQCSACNFTCFQCSSLSNCSKCSSTYYLNTISRNCVNITSCPSGYFANSETSQCETCKAPCKTCINLLVCTSCIDSNSILYAQQCLLQCPQNYYLGIENGSKVCHKCPSTCKTCINDSICLSCQENYFLDSSNATCASSCPDKTFYDTLTHQCAKCIPPCKQCQSETICISCVDNYYLKQSLCINICPIKTFLNSSSQNCDNCPSICSQCSSFNVCSSCQSSYHLYNSSCYEFCPPSTFQTISRQCKACSPQCQQCMGTGQNCTKCYDNEYLKQATCLQTCPHYYFPSLFNSKKVCRPCSRWCMSCYNETYCTICTASFLNNNFCVQQCPIGTYPELYTRVCEACNQFCIQCTNSLTCLKCDNQHVLFNVQCIPKPCPQQLYYSVANNQCIEPSKCVTQNIGNGMDMKQVIHYIPNHADKQCYIDSCRFDLILSSKGNQCLYFCLEGEYINSKIQCQKGSENVYYRAEIVGNGENLQILVLGSQDIFSQSQQATNWKFQLIQNSTNQFISNARLLQASNQSAAIINSSFIKSSSRNSIEFILGMDQTLLPQLQSQSSITLTPFALQISLKDPYRAYYYDGVPLQNYKSRIQLEKMTIYKKQPIANVFSYIFACTLMLSSIVISLIVLWIHWKPHLLLNVLDYQQFLWLICLSSVNLQPIIEPFLSCFFVMHLKWFPFQRLSQRRLISPVSYYKYTQDIDLMLNILSNIVISATILLIVLCIFLACKYIKKIAQTNIGKTITANIKNHIKSYLLCLLCLNFANIFNFACINIFFQGQGYFVNNFSFWKLLSYFIVIFSFGAIPALFYVHKYYAIDQGIDASKKKLVLFLPLYKFLRKVMFVFFLTFYYYNIIYALCLTMLLTAMIFIIIQWYYPYYNTLRNYLAMIQEAILFTFMGFLLVYTLNQNNLDLGYGVFLLVLAIALIISTLLYPIHCIYKYFKYGQFNEPVQQISIESQSSKAIFNNQQNAQRSQSQNSPSNLLKQLIKGNINGEDECEADVSDQCEQQPKTQKMVTGVSRLKQKKQSKIKQFKNYIIEQDHQSDPSDEFPQKQI